MKILFKNTRRQHLNLFVHI